MRHLFMKLQKCIYIHNRHNGIRFKNDKIWRQKTVGNQKIFSDALIGLIIMFAFIDFDY